MSSAALVAPARLGAASHVLTPDLFAGRRVLVSGGGSGIGLAIAWLFGRLGARIAICGRSADRLDAAASEMARAGIDVFARGTDIRDEGAVEELHAAIAARFDGLDILVNNAGGQYPQAASEIKPKGWRAVVETNLTGSWLMMQAAAKRWRDAGQPGSIVNIIAVVGRGMPGVAHTAAARAGVVALSKTVAIEWAPLKIRVNCVAPGLISSEGMNVYDPGAVKAMIQTNVMKRFGQIEEIANAVCFVGGDGGSFITGEVLHVDGGNQIWGDQWTIPKPDYFKVDE